MADAQSDFVSYYGRNSTYPPLSSGSYIPGYTNSHWPISWNALRGLINRLPDDPVNDWSGCPGYDEETCWNPTSRLFLCPTHASVYEYSATPDGQFYELHVPLEYFSDEDVPVVDEFIDADHFTTDRWCTPEDTYTPFRTDCGDGVVNPTIGEQCEPPNTATCTSDCRYVGSLITASCGNDRVDPGESCDDGELNGEYNHCALDCAGPAPAYCGNPAVDPVTGLPASGGVRDYDDENTNGVQDPGEPYLEYCDIRDDIYDVTGFCDKRETCKQL